MHVMGEALVDLLELVFRLFKRLAIVLLQGVFEFLMEFVIDRLVSMLGRQQEFLYRLSGTRWVSIPLTLASFLLILASPIVLLIALLRLASGS